MNKKDLKNIENLKEVNKDKSADRAVLIAGVIIVILMLGGIYLYRGYVVLSHVLKIEVNFDNLWEIIKGKSDKNRTKINEIFQES